MTTGPEELEVRTNTHRTLVRMAVLYVPLAFVCTAVALYSFSHFLGGAAGAIVPAFFVIGMAIQWVFAKFAVSPFNSLLVTFGLTVIVESLIQWIWTADYRKLEYAYASVKFKVAITLVARSLKPVWLILKTMVSPAAPSMPAASAAPMLITGGRSVSLMVPVPLPVPMVKVVVSFNSSVASSVVG